MNPFSPRFVIF